MIVNSIIGKGTTFKGDLITDELIRVEGDFTGMIRNKSGEVMLGKSSRFKGNIYSKDLTLSGIFKGSLYIENRLSITSDAIIIGSVYTRYLQVEKGAILNIEVSMEEEDIKNNIESSEEYYKEIPLNNNNKNNIKDNIL